MRRAWLEITVVVAVAMLGCRAQQAQAPALPAQSQSGAAAPLLVGEQTPRSAICPAGASYGPPLVPGLQPELIKDGFVFVEGPVWSDQLSGILFSEMDLTDDVGKGPPSRIHLLTIGGQQSVFLANSGSNGLAINPQGLWACTHDDQAVSFIDLKTRQRRAVVTQIGGRHFNSPNDLTLTSTGQIYFTDPDYQRGTRPGETGVTGVYWATTDGAVTLVDATLDKPNGISLSPDESKLYVSAADGYVYQYRLDKGVPRDRAVLTEVVTPDGMAVDCAGNLYVASHEPGNLEVFSPLGNRIAAIEVGPKVTNVAFGGLNRKTLYITAGTGLFTLPVAVPGYPY